MDKDLDLAQSSFVHYGIGTTEEEAEIKQKLGHFNDYPPNVEEITQSHFLWLWSVSPAWRKREYRQAFKRDEFGERIDRQMHELHFWIFPDFSGIGWESHYDGKATRSEIDAYTCTYFKFIYCDHEYETIENRMSYWVGKCKKCGYTKAVDSSG
jgi:hypothetical protein